MKIPLKNKILEVKLLISKTANLRKLEEELIDFFSKNEIEGYKIKKFRIEESFTGLGYNIIPLEPPIEECLSDKEENHSEEIEKIGKKYGIKNLGFIYWCYHK
jgi:hypothetical protein